MNLIGQILLNQYRVEAFVASGGMGVVYRVWDLNRNVNLAMKVLHADLADDPSIFKRFQREARALQKLAHPNIVPFYGLERTLDSVFLLQRFIDGPTLKEILKDRGALPVGEALIYLKALCAALGYAHIHGVIHCDVKPGNVMVDQGGNIYLTDFGIARHAESTTTTLATAGTAAYMAPEQIRGEAVRPETDVYALGILLFEMLTGQRPFQGDERGTESTGGTANERIRHAHLTSLPSDPIALNPTIPRALARVVLKALGKKPENRFSSTQSMLVAAYTALEIDPREIQDRAPVLTYKSPQAHPTPSPLKYSSSPRNAYSVSPQSHQDIPLSSSISRRTRGKWILMVGGSLAVLLIILAIVGIGTTPGSPEAMVPTSTNDNFIILTETSLSSVVIPPSPLKIPSPSATPLLSTTPTHTPLPTATLIPTPIVDPAIVEPYCSMFGTPSVVVQEHQPVTLWWRWDASTLAFVEDHIDSARYEVYLDGYPVSADRRSEIEYLEDKGWYRVSWFADVGVLDPGTHLAERYLSWTRRISDGWDTFGPGGDIETESDDCTIIVR